MADKLKIPRTFTQEGVDPFQAVEWEKRKSTIKSDSGKALFEQDDVEAPKHWSHMATNVVASKYFYGDPQKPGEREKSVRQLIHRVARTITDWGIEDGYFTPEQGQVFYDELSWLGLHQYGAFNSPVWFNVGLFHQHGIGKDSAPGNWFYNPATQRAERSATHYEHPQSSACFIQSVGDNMESIMALAASEAMLFKYGSGTGTNLATIRSEKEQLSGGGRPSGPLSFLRIYDQVANVVKSGGKTRRAAKMNILDIWHGDIEEFIDAKVVEEKKAWDLIDAGWDGSFGGDAYGTVAFQNENLSVRISDEFMWAAIEGKPWKTRAVTTGKELETKSAKDLLRKIAQGTHVCGDPGVQYDSTIQKWHTCKGTEPIHATNPCSEYVFLDNTACNLASLNLLKFRRQDGTFDVDKFQAAVRIYIIAQEILVDRSSYPVPTITENSHVFRTLGLGYANLGSLIMSYGVPYDSDEARHITSAVTALMTSTAYAQSAEMAQVKGPFPGYHDARCSHVPKPLKPSNVESMLEVVNLHAAEAAKIQIAPQFDYILQRALDTWKETVTKGTQHGFRNAQVTVLAPTGTISFLMDCDTTGIEPDLALVKYKNLVGGGSLKIVNRTVPMALKVLGYTPEDQARIVAHIEKWDTIEDVADNHSGLKPEHLPVFDCALKPTKGQRSISYMAHLKIMAAAQPFISGAISKTVNMPKEATVEEIQDVYIQAWKMGLKCVAIYRDGSKRIQPLNTSKNNGNGNGNGKLSDKLLMEIALLKEQLKGCQEKLGKPLRKHLPETRTAVTHKFSIAGQEGYLTVGLFEDNTPGEIFISMNKAGSIVSGLMDTVATLTSVSLQYGVPLLNLVQKFSYQRFEPSGFTNNPDIRQAHSPIDYIFRWLGLKFCPEFREQFQQNTKQPDLAIPGLNEQVARRINVPVPEMQITDTTAILDPARLQANAALYQPNYEDAPHCPKCGSQMQRSGSCHRCSNCGESLGCSG